MKFIIVILIFSLFLGTGTGFVIDPGFFSHKIQNNEHGTEKTVKFIDPEFEKIYNMLLKHTMRMGRILENKNQLVSTYDNSTPSSLRL